MWCQHLYHMIKKCQVAPCFNHLDLRNNMVPLTVQWVLYHILFQMSLPSEQNGTIDNTVSVTWQQHWYQLHHVTKKVMLHPIFIIVTKWMQWWHWQCHWHHKYVSRHVKTLCRHQVISSHCVDTSRHCLVVQTHLDIIRHCLDTSLCLETSSHFLLSSRRCLDTFMIILKNCLGGKIIIYIWYNGLDRYVIRTCIST